MHCVVLMRWRGVLLGMHQMNPDYLDPDFSDRFVTADILLRQEPDEENEEEDEGDNKEKEKDDEESDEGYSE